ncbi:NAD(P)H-hydrate dehydratase [Paracoccus caeni]|uniref:Bifunctional NAD(P)H-hydrate repair enzyme n=1 Tax=Paracoccus caeni TaxID=657651 RepID=A0A934SBH4_9RHOB|nr:NAD(P)H-hydrate dehydratase [Paracoccus caeni]MBK4215751.1 NAD(P)H-hydrate dehydratase [Paracoccus caeni]
MLKGTEILSCAQMRAIESAAMASGEVTGLELMERAGRAVAGQIRLRWPKPGRVTVLCGPGNNGGDGYVVARRLHRAGWRVRVLGLENTPGPDAAKMKRLWQEIGPILPLEANLLPTAPDDLIVDAIFGIGLTRPPEDAIAALLTQLADVTNPLVAIDCPSGLCLDSGRFLSQIAPRAVLTITFDSLKTGHLIDAGLEHCGKVIVADIGLSHWRRYRQATRPDGKDVTLPRRITSHHLRISDLDPDTMQQLGKQSSAHKFSHGHALIISGMAPGAARLSARAALRVGAGLVTLCPEEPPLDIPTPPDALMRRWLDEPEDMAHALQDTRVTALCIGPGCGIDRAAALLPPALAARGPCVLDADALSAIAIDPNLWDALHDGCVLTPHGGEFARLFPDLTRRLSDIPATGPAWSRLDAAQEAAARSGTCLLLKGRDTIIAAPFEQARIVTSLDTPWLATAGAGDVLAGIITGLLARGFNPFDAASLGALIHAQAARLFGPGLIADDLPDMIPQVFRQMGV